MFNKNPVYDTEMASGHFQQIEKNRLQDKFGIASFLLKNVGSKTFVLLISQIKFVERTKKLELNLNLKQKRT